MVLHQLFFALLLIFLPTQIGYHVWPDWAMVLGRRVDYLAPTVYVTDILLLLTVGSWFIERTRVIPANEPRSIFYFLRTGFRVSSKLRINMPGMTIGLLLLCTFICINVVFAKNQPVALYAWIKAFEYAGLGWYIIKTKPTFSFVIWYLSFGILYSSIIAIAQFLLQHSIGVPLWFLGERTFFVDTPGIARVALRWSLGFGYWDFGLRMRPYATFPHPNVLGGFLAMTLPLVIIQLSLPCRQAGNNPIRQFSKKIFYVATLFLGYIALALTFSRSAWIVSTVGVFICIKYLLVRKKPTSFFPFMLVAVLLALLVFFISRSFSLNDESIVVRKELNASAIKLFAHSPLFGVGLGNFLVELPKALPSRQIYFLQPVHNIYLLVLSETGLIGFLLFTGCIFYVFLRKFWQRRVYKKTHCALNIWHGALGILLILGLVDHYPLTLQQGQLLFTLFTALTIYI